MDPKQRVGGSSPLSASSPSKTRRSARKARIALAGSAQDALLFGPVREFRLDLIESPPPTVRTVAHILPRMVARTGDVSDLADAGHPMAHHHISLSQFHRSA